MSATRRLGSEIRKQQRRALKRFAPNHRQVRLGLLRIMRDSFGDPVQRVRDHFTTHGIDSQAAQARFLASVPHAVRMRFYGAAVEPAMQGGRPTGRSFRI